MEKCVQGTAILSPWASEHGQIAIIWFQAAGEVELFERRCNLDIVTMKHKVTWETRDNRVPWPRDIDNGRAPGGRPTSA